jgi:carbon-monoxide dehydrogenase small subunit
MTKTIRLSVNGIAYERTVEPRTLLSDFIRHDLVLHGTHVGCEHGVCGACTVLVNGEAMRACLLLAVQMDDAEITTIEGVSIEGTLSPLQRAFQTHHALQCGFCTPGIILSVTRFLERTPHPTDEEIRGALSGHLCRCTGYLSIINAIRAAAESPCLGSDATGNNSHLSGGSS